MNISSIASMFKFLASFCDIAVIKLSMKKPELSKYHPTFHLAAAAEWLCNAQDATPDGGVARSYSLIYNQYFGKKGWFASYPETTGYIIQTFFDYAKFSGVRSFFDRAVKMADWEIQIQLDNGSVQGGMIGEKPTPAIFNTGQVIFGWTRAFEETNDGKYLDAAVRAGEFLMANQEGDGSWRKNLSDYISSNMPFCSYNTRSAWALYVVGLCAKREDFIESSLKNIKFTLTQQLENGWFSNNCLSKPDQPLLHTIAYCIRGILEVAVLSSDDNLKRSAQLAADALLEKQQPDGGLAGRFDKNWQPTVEWNCLTGDAQISIIWSRLYQITGDNKYLNAAEKANNYLMSRQIICPENKALNGGITGSYPINGDYGKYEILNWAVKFFMDAVLLHLKIFSDPNK
jgi:prenyltransferase beta subunit